MKPPRLFPDDPRNPQASLVRFVLVIAAIVSFFLVGFFLELMGRFVRS